MSTLFSVSTYADLFGSILSLIILLLSARIFGAIFEWYRQPKVIGEIIGGLLIGPTGLGWLAPILSQSLLPDSEVGIAVFNSAHEVGLVLLMFCTGMEMRSLFRVNEERTVFYLVVMGCLVPFVSGVFCVQLNIIPPHEFMGKANNPFAFLLVISIAMAVTSIPVISRIMYDLDLLKTSFARIVLSAATLEDIVLFVVLNIALSMVATGVHHYQGLPGLIGIDINSAAGYLYHLVISGMFLLILLSYGRRFMEFLSQKLMKRIFYHRPMLSLLSVLILVILLSVFLRVSLIFGALVAGVIVSSPKLPFEEQRKIVKRYGFNIFIPIYFAIVGARLDLLNHFNISFFMKFLFIACTVKALSCFIGACLARETFYGAANLAVAMNARGGPGIVLASVAIDTAIINLQMYSMLVMLSVVTSMFVGSLLDFLKRKGVALR